MTTDVEREPVRVVDLARQHGDLLEDLEFDRRLLLGPGVLLFVDNRSTLHNFELDNIDAIWPACLRDRDYFGAIAVAHCRFVDCRFERVGLMGSPSFRERLLEAIYRDTPPSS